MARTIALAALLLAAALAGCGGDDEPISKAEPAASASSEAGTSAGPTPSETAPAPPADPSPVRPAQAQNALEDGLHELLGGGQVDFRYTVSLGTTQVMETTGRAALDGGWRASTTFSQEVADEATNGEATDLRMEVLAPGSRDLFMQMLAWPEPATGCWMRMPEGQVPVGFLAMTPGLPAYVGVLGALRPLGFDPEDDDRSQIVATVSLRSALLLLHGRAVQGLAVPPDGVRGTRVRATAYLEDGVVTGLTIRGRDIVAAVAEAGGDTDSDTAEVVSGFWVALTYTPAPRDADRVTAPDPGLVMTAEDMDARRGCRG